MPALFCSQIPIQSHRTTHGREKEENAVQRTLKFFDKSCSLDLYSFTFDPEKLTNGGLDGWHAISFLLYVGKKLGVNGVTNFLFVVCCFAFSYKKVVVTLCVTCIKIVVTGLRRVSDTRLLGKLLQCSRS